MAHKLSQQIEESERSWELLPVPAVWPGLSAEAPFADLPSLAVSLGISRLWSCSGD